MADSQSGASEQNSGDRFFAEGAAPPDLAPLTDEVVDRAYNEFVVAMQRTGTTRKAIRAALETVWSRS